MKRLRGAKIKKNRFLLGNYLHLQELLKTAAYSACLWPLKCTYILPISQISPNYRYHIIVTPIHGKNFDATPCLVKAGSKALPKHLLGLYDLHISWNLHVGVQNHFSGFGPFCVHQFCALIQFFFRLQFRYF